MYNPETWTREDELNWQYGLMAKEALENGDCSEADRLAQELEEQLAKGDKYDKN